MTTCPDCGQEFKSAAGLTSHRKYRHSSSQEAKAPANRPRDTRGNLPTMQTANRRKRVVELVDEGHTWQEIAVLVDVSPTQARRDYFKALQEVPADAVHQHRINHNERLEWLWEKTAIMVDSTGDPAAVNAAVNVLKRQATLNGIDAPQVIQVDNGIDITRIVDRIKALTSGAE